MARTGVEPRFLQRANRMTPKTLITLAELREQRDAWERDGVTVAFVPTMGALHAGHLSLVDQARTLADRVIVSVFVNPIQFGPNEDFAKYPRTLAADLELLGAKGVEAVFLPNATTMYPEGFQTYVHNTEMAQGLCGASRKNHFEGVLTVVLKLFHLVRPHVAVFGKKDYQQWRLIGRMVEDLNLPLTVVGGETLRETDGLAMSSRNRYLAPDERQAAICLYRGLAAAKERAQDAGAVASAVVQAFLDVVQLEPQVALEYVELRRQKDLSSLEGSLDAPAVLLAAAHVGGTRLIDNIEIG